MKYPNLHAEIMADYRGYEDLASQINVTPELLKSIAAGTEGVTAGELIKLASWLDCFNWNYIFSPRLSLFSNKSPKHIRLMHKLDENVRRIVLSVNVRSRASFFVERTSIYKDYLKLKSDFWSGKGSTYAIYRCINRYVDIELYIIKDNLAPKKIPRGIEKAPEPTKVQGATYN